MTHVQTFNNYLVLIQELVGILRHQILYKSTRFQVANSIVNFIDQIKVFCEIKNDFVRDQSFVEDLVGEVLVVQEIDVQS